MQHKNLAIDKTVIASIPQNIDFVPYKRRTRKPVLLEYCTQPIFCGIDAITDNYCTHSKIFRKLIKLHTHIHFYPSLYMKMSLGEIVTEFASNNYNSSTTHARCCLTKSLCNVTKIVGHMKKPLLHQYHKILASCNIEGELISLFFLNTACGQYSVVLTNVGLPS